MPRADTPAITYYPSKQAQELLAKMTGPKNLAIDRAFVEYWATKAPTQLAPGVHLEDNILTVTMGPVQEVRLKGPWNTKGRWLTEEEEKDLNHEP